MNENFAYFVGGTILAVFLNFFGNRIAKPVNAWLDTRSTDRATSTRRKTRAALRREHSVAYYYRHNPNEFYLELARRLFGSILDLAVFLPVGAVLLFGIAVGLGTDGPQVVMVETFPWINFHADWQYYLLLISTALSIVVVIPFYVFRVLRNVINTTGLVARVTNYDEYTSRVANQIAKINNSHYNYILEELERDGASDMRGAIG